MFNGSGKKVTSKKQAVAIGLSEARKAGGKAPKRNSFLRLDGCGYFESGSGRLEKSLFSCANKQ